MIFLNFWHGICEYLNAMDNQRTIRKSIQFKGVGLHTGKMSMVRLYPAEPDSGIVFFRKDIQLVMPIPASNHYVVNTNLSTTLGHNNITIATIEHLMSAIWGLGIDNVLIEVVGPEIPILDGSSFIFVKKILKAGLEKQHKKRRYLVITKPVFVTEGDRYCYLIPDQDQKFSCSIDFKHPVIGKQSFEFTLNEKNYYKQISEARTFGFLEDMENLRQKGLIVGGSLENAIVLDQQRILNKEGLRFKDEFVRHKLLDMVGDIALSGVRILGHFVGHKSGHRLHYQLIQKVLKESESQPIILPFFQKTVSA